MASIVIAGDTSGSVTISAPAIAGTPTLTLPTTSGTLVVTGGAQTIEFAAGSAASPSITFTGDTNTGIFSPTADTVGFTTGGSERMRIDSSGNVLIGTTSASPVSGITAAGQVVMAGSRAFLGTLAGGDTALGGTSGSNFTSLYVNGSENVRLNISGSLVLKGGFADANGTGITFPATQSASSDANTLDDYEEGTWTPSYGGGITAATYGSARAGTYIKIGRSVTVHFVIMTDSVTRGSGGVTITGLPFTSSSATGSEASLSFSGAFRFDSNPPLWGRVGLNATTIALYSSINATGPGTDPVAVAPTDLNTGSGNRNIIVATVTYFTS